MFPAILLLNVKLLSQYKQELKWCSVGETNIWHADKEINNLYFFGRLILMERHQISIKNPENTHYTKVLHWFTHHWVKWIFDPKDDLALDGETLVGKQRRMMFLIVFQKIFTQSLCPFCFLGWLLQLEISVGLMSGGNALTLMFFTFVASVVCFVLSSCWKTNQWSIFRMEERRAEGGKEVLIQDFIVHGPIDWPPNTVKLSCIYTGPEA